MSQHSLSSEKYASSKEVMGLLVKAANGKASWSDAQEPFVKYLRRIAQERKTKSSTQEQEKCFDPLFGMASAHSLASLSAAGSITSNRLDDEVSAFLSKLDASGKFNGSMKQSERSTKSEASLKHSRRSQKSHTSSRHSRRSQNSHTSSRHSRRSQKTNRSSDNSRQPKQSRKDPECVVGENHSHRSSTSSYRTEQSRRDPESLMSVGDSQQSDGTPKRKFTTRSPTSPTSVLQSECDPPSQHQKSDPEYHGEEPSQHQISDPEYHGEEPEEQLWKYGAEQSYLHRRGMEPEEWRPNEQPDGMSIEFLKILAEATARHLQESDEIPGQMLENLGLLMALAGISLAKTEPRAVDQMRKKDPDVDDEKSAKTSTSKSSSRRSQKSQEKSVKSYTSRSTTRRNKILQSEARISGKKKDPSVIGDMSAKSNTSKSSARRSRRIQLDPVETTPNLDPKVKDDGGSYIGLSLNNNSRLSSKRDPAGFDAKQDPTGFEANNVKENGALHNNRGIQGDGYSTITISESSIEDDITMASDVLELKSRLHYGKSQEPDGRLSNEYKYDWAKDAVGEMSRIEEFLAERMEQIETNIYSRF